MSVTKHKLVFDHRGPFMIDAPHVPIVSSPPFHKSETNASVVEPPILYPFISHETDYTRNSEFIATRETMATNCFSFFQLDHLLSLFSQEEIDRMCIMKQMNVSIKQQLIDMIEKNKFSLQEKKDDPLHIIDEFLQTCSASEDNHWLLRYVCNSFITAEMIQTNTFMNSLKDNIDIVYERMNHDITVKQSLKKWKEETLHALVHSHYLTMMRVTTYRDLRSIILCDLVGVEFWLAHHTSIPDIDFLHCVSQLPLL